jgi:aspartate-semialdehyde dehydrogenase
MSKAKVAIVGGNSLIGRELRELLQQDTRFGHVMLLGVDDEEAGALTEQGGEPTIITPLDEEYLREARVVFLAGDAHSSRQVLDMVRRMQPAPALIDATGALEQASPVVRLRAPLSEAESSGAPPALSAGVDVIAHPAASALAMVLLPLLTAGEVKRVVAHVFEPASERGRKGISELQEQTVSLLSFKPLPKDVFDEQVSFNLLSAYGEAAPESLQDVELRVERHLASLLEGIEGLPLPSLRLVQAPVFHGHTFSLWVQFSSAVEVDAVVQALASTHVEVRQDEGEPPTIIGQAGQSGVSVGAIYADRNDTHAVWIWMVADNLRITAENAVMLARMLLEPDPSRWVQ